MDNLQGNIWLIENPAFLILPEEHVDCLFKINNLHSYFAYLAEARSTKSEPQLILGLFEPFPWSPAI